VSRFGLLPLSATLDHAGPIGRRVADVARLYAAMAGADPRDPATARPPGGRSPPPGRARRPVLGIPREHFYDRLDPDVDAALRTAHRTLERLGARLRPVSLPWVGDAHAAASGDHARRGTAVHARWLRERPQDYGEDVRLLVELGLFVPGPAYVRAREARVRLRAELDATLAGGVAALVVPTLLVPAVRHGVRHVTVGGATDRSGWRSGGSPTRST
jgi:aspartyl-tRNA(Asn)/glutamyl-tRNA(Gln) amidotransferase subunit A